MENAKVSLQGNASTRAVATKSVSPQQHSRCRFDIKTGTDDNTNPECERQCAEKSGMHDRAFGCGSVAGQCREVTAAPKQGGVSNAECRQDKFKRKIGMTADMHRIVKEECTATYKGDAERQIQPWDNLLDQSLV